MSGRLTTTSYAVLAQVAVRPWSIYELAQQRVRYFRYVWPRAESAIYREVKRLSSMGLIEGRKEYTGNFSDVSHVYTEWSAKGATFLTPPIDRGAEIRCYMRDPDGHLIEVGQAAGVIKET